MDGLAAGAFGTSTSFFLRLGQIVFSIGSLFFMCFDVHFYSFTVFCYLVTIMGLVAPWSTTLAVVDAYTLIVKRFPREPRILLIITAGDWVLSFFSLAAACSTASVASILQSAQSPICRTGICGRYQVSALLAFLAWFLTSTSCLFNLWILPSL